MAGGSISGVVGRIEWSYFVAAAINGYTVTRSPENQWRLTATVVMADAFKLTQQPLMFVAPHATGEWRWPIAAGTIEMGTDGGPNHLRARLGPPEG